MLTPASVKQIRRPAAGALTLPRSLRRGGRGTGGTHTLFPDLFLYAVREFFDDGVGEDFFCDALDLGAGSVCGEAFS